MSKKHLSGNSLMDLRLAILRTIALVWDDDLQGKGTLRKKVIDMNFHEINKFLEKEFGYKMPYENFGVRFMAATSTWNFFGDHQWDKPTEETITVTIPETPSAPDPQRPEYLMEYYSRFPDLFGSTLRPGVKSVSGGGGGSSTSPDDTNLSGNSYNLGVSEDSFLAFGAVVSKLVAAAWGNPDLMDMIIYKESEDNGRRAGTADTEYSAMIIDMLKEHFDYVFPWAFELKFIAPAEGESFWKKNGDWRGLAKNGRPLIRNSVALEIPEAPTAKDSSNISLALARYNAIGPAYPFTCS